MILRVTLDSNIWERIFDSNEPESLAIRDALAEKRVEGFICESAFRIEAIRKSQRGAYFSKPSMNIHAPIAVVRDGRPFIQLSFGPDDSHHPGLPEVQAERLRLAVAAGLRVMRGMSWLGLPSPKEILDRSIFVEETTSQRDERMQRQSEIDDEICRRGVGKALFDASGGWAGFNATSYSEKRVARVCAEWADGELAAAHIAYANDILCTEDYAFGSKQSIFNAENRAWLVARFGVRFARLSELYTMLST
ncbi:MAG TPA: hypothetical protein VIJ63_15125 [Roseiarcus sp.]